MYKLYGRKGAGSLAVEAMLAQCGADYAVEDLIRDSHGRLPQWFAELNPQMQIPTLRLPDDSLMTESAAILIHLGDSVPQAGLAPALDSPRRPHYLRWMLFFATTVYMSDLRMYYPERYTDDPAGGAEAIKSRAATHMANEWAMFAEALGAGPFILGETMSAVDIYAAMLVSWNLDLAEFLGRHGNVAKLYRRVTAAPAIAGVWARNEV